jgi:hypothetical protein
VGDIISGYPSKLSFDGEPKEHNLKGKASTIDLLIKASLFCKIASNVCNVKLANLNKFVQGGQLY